MGTMTEKIHLSLCGEADDNLHEISQVCPHKLSLLINVTQSNGKSLPMDSYTERMITQKIDHVAGVQPLSVIIMNEIESMVELREDDPIIDVSHLIQGLASWEGQSVNVSCVMSSKRGLLHIIQEGEEMRNKQKSWKKSSN